MHLGLEMYLLEMHLMEEMQVEALMTKKVCCIRPEMMLKDAIDLMRKNADSCLVITKDDLPLGLISEYDLVRILNEFLDYPHVSHYCVSKFMSSPPIILKLGDSIFDALTVAQSREIRYILVVDHKGAIAGLITQADLIRASLQMGGRQGDSDDMDSSTLTQNLIRTNAYLKMLALEDPLLRIGNRRAMEVDLDFTHELAKRYKRNYSVVLFDIDFFKRYNDCYGHVEGDNTLKAVAGYLKKSIRNPDRIYRYGGEEFLLLLPETPIKNAPIMAERLVKGIAHLAIPHCENPFKVVTISGGIGSAIEEAGEKPTWKQVLEEADKGLYHAKKKGRNQIVVECASSGASQ